MGAHLLTSLSSIVSQFERDFKILYSIKSVESTQILTLESSNKFRVKAVRYYRKLRKQVPEKRAFGCLVAE
jgi:hypothetical protein